MKNLGIVDPINILPGEICEYESIVYGQIEVEFLMINVVENWPIQTAQVRFANGRVDSVLTDKIRPTGRKAEEHGKIELVFGSDIRKGKGKSA